MIPVIPDRQRFVSVYLGMITKGPVEMEGVYEWRDEKEIILHLSRDCLKEPLFHISSDFWKNWQMGCGSGDIDVGGSSDTGDDGSGAEDTLAVKKERDRNWSKWAHFPWDY